VKVTAETNEALMEQLNELATEEYFSIRFIDETSAILDYVVTLVMPVELEYETDDPDVLEMPFNTNTNDNPSFA
jgi:hypothetical protein